MTSVQETVASIIADVKREGDIAIERICKHIGDESFKELTRSEISDACNRLSQDRKDTIDFAARNIRRFAEAIKATSTDVTVDYAEYTAGMRFVPVNRVACYVPGGRYPLPSTALMTTIPAAVAGVNEIFVAGPALTDEVIYAGIAGGATRFFRLGGAQAIAAFAFGTETVPKVDMAVGPGNAYVAEAKRQLIGTVGIDILAGPSEIALIADDSAEIDLLVRDLLSQAEHDPNAICFLFTTSQRISEAIGPALERRLQEAASRLPNFIRQSVNNITVRGCASLADCAAASNAVAPEHLLLHVVDPDSFLSMLTNYGALFIGKSTTVAYGDYCAGPNHTLPTGGTARFASGLSPLTFLRTQTWVKATNPAPTLSEYTRRFAEIEGLLAHADAAAIRVEKSVAR